MGDHCVDGRGFIALWAAVVSRGLAERLDSGVDELLGD
jgi:hypothetical protein